jgi:homoserine dehydrogenase
VKDVGIGLLGFGTVGAGVVEGLQRNGEIIAARVGARPVLRKVADLDLESDRGVALDPAIMTRDVASVIDDPATDIIVELIGGTEAARHAVVRALGLGKPVVTANKALLAEHGGELFGLAEEKRTDLYFGASVGGGIPIVRALREGLIANRISAVFGILNGTCNYVLTRMTAEGLSFEAALSEAQARGYAETDPGLDVDGLDTAHKAVILAMLAYGLHVPMESVWVEGIRDLSTTDVRYALDLGYRVKLLAVIKRPVGTGPSADGEIEVRVHPSLVSCDHMLASVGGVFNAVKVQGDLVGDTLYYGRGAGRHPTASTVIGDIADVARNLIVGAPRRVPCSVSSGAGGRIREMDRVETRYYLRLSLLDKPGVLARIAAVLGGHGISIASVLQKETRAGQHVPVVMVTHQAREGEINDALEDIDALDVVGAETVRLRIEN